MGLKMIKSNESVAGEGGCRVWRSIYTFTHNHNVSPLNIFTLVTNTVLNVRLLLARIGVSPIRAGATPSPPA
jgi:hypothetical protein